MSELTRRTDELERKAAQARMKTNPRVTVITIGVPSSGRLCPLEMVIALQAQSWPANTGVAWSVVCGHDVDAAREKIAENAVELGAKYLWFIDDDTVPPMDAARKLIYVLQQEEAKGSNVMVAGGITRVSGALAVTATTELYNPSTNLWSTTGSMTTGVTGATMALLPTGSVLVVGGDTTPTGSPTPCS